MAIQAVDPVRGAIAAWQRGVFFMAAFCLLFPTNIWVDLLGAGLLALGWTPQILKRGAAAA
jgi:hypothetical protein